jgi:hypothetical protein
LLNSTAFTVMAASINKAVPASCASSGSGISGTLKDASNYLMDYTFKCGVNGTAGNAGTGQGRGGGKNVALGIEG